MFLSVSQLEERFEIRKQILDDVQSKRLENVECHLNPTVNISVDLDVFKVCFLFTVLSVVESTLGKTPDSFNSSSERVNTWQKRWVKSGKIQSILSAELSAIISL